MCDVTCLQEVLEGKLCSALFHKLNLNWGASLSTPRNAGLYHRRSCIPEMRNINQI